MKPVNGRLYSVYRTIPLRQAELPSRDQITADLESSNKYVAARAKELLRQIERSGRLSQTYPYPIQAWAIGNDARLVTLGGEVVVDYSLRPRD